MSKKDLFLAVTAICVWIPMIAIADDEPQLRTWTDKTGRFRIEAVYLGCEDGVVRLQKPNVSVKTSIRLAHLSESDQSFVRAKLEAERTAPKPDVASESAASGSTSATAEASTVPAATNQAEDAASPTESASSTAAPSSNGTATTTAALKDLGPVVAQIQMRLQAGEKVLDVIEKGDLLSVIKEEDNSYMVTTYSGKMGLISKATVVSLADSVPIYDELLKEKPQEARIYTLRASAWWAKGDREKALADYDRAIEAGYKEPHAFENRGLFHASMGNYDKAIEDFGTAIELGAKGDSPLINRAALYLVQQKFDLAIKDYDEAIQRNDKKASTYEQRALAHKVNQQYEKAIEDFGKAIELDRSFASAWMGRGFLWFQTGESEKAVEDFSVVIELDPKAAQAYNNRGYNRQLLGDYQNALADYDQAIRLSPDYTLALQNKAWLLAAADDEKIRDGAKAVETAKRACELGDYKDISDLKVLAAALAEAGHFDKAIGWQEKVIELVDEDDRPAEREILEKFTDKKPLRLADLEVEAGQP